MGNKKNASKLNSGQKKRIPDGYGVKIHALREREKKLFKLGARIEELRKAYNLLGESLPGSLAFSYPPRIASLKRTGESTHRLQAQNVHRGNGFNIQEWRNTDNLENAQVAAELSYSTSLNRE